ncbi:hypothetical protein, partial [Nucisporomicrobium flavum]|uniref:hypothetical protein n=1 Tax=Nucisporomicrobium flavum TaxID=2785915 RepID=UPI001F299BFF
SIRLLIVWGDALDARGRWGVADGFLSLGGFRGVAALPLPMAWLLIEICVRRCLWSCRQCHRRG